MSSKYLLIDFFNKQLVSLKKNKIAEYKQKSEMIIDAILDIPKTKLYTLDFFINEQQRDKLNIAFLELHTDKPVQHIIGKTYFYNDRFFTPEGVFIPRPETELLIDCIVNDNGKFDKKSVLDVGCGSGCVGVTVASLFKNFKVTGIDISKKAVKTSSLNANKLNVTNINIIEKDFFEMKPQKYDIIVSNPPYLDINEVSRLDKTVRKHDPLLALSDKENGLKFYTYFMNNISELLKSDGVMYIEIPKSKITNQIIDMINNNSKIDSIIFKDLEQKDRVIKVFFKK
jgi:release factor glutamine methyltransferase|tara:strand:+ start:4182 stop:5036 length:855 start_codon:yes stop_codon:yes gene_type:complete